MLVGSCIWGTICKYENGTPKVARNAFNIGEVWNPACCHGNKTVKLKLRSTFSRILLHRIIHFWYRLAEISFFIIFDQNLVECMTYFKKLEYLWNKKRYYRTFLNFNGRVKDYGWEVKFLSKYSQWGCRGLWMRLTCNPLSRLFHSGE